MGHRFSKHQLCALASLSGLVAWTCATPLHAQTKAGSTAPVAIPVGTAPAPGTLGGVPLLNGEALAALQTAIKGPQRIEPARDRWRNPAATLQFFGVRPGDTVIEIWPGQGWYSSILGPYLKQGSGKLVVGHFDAAASTSPVVRQFVETYTARFGASPEVYGTVNVVAFGPRSGPLAPANSVDSVLTFRNIHNWMAQGWAEKAFGDFFLALKPGGILGIEEHRGRTDEPQDPLARDGYVREDYVIQLAREAGFEFVGRSEINANLADTKDHPFGVWTLPPVSRTSAAGQPDDPGFDRARYLAIGESDRMTLRFRKPLSAKGASAGKPAPKEPVVVVPSPPATPPPRRPWIAPFIKPPVKAPPLPVAPVPVPVPVPVPTVTPPVTNVPEAASTERTAVPPVIAPPPAPKPETAPPPVPQAPAAETNKPAMGAPETDMPVTVKPLEDVKPPVAPSAEKPPEKPETAPPAMPAPKPQPSAKTIAKTIAKPATKPVAKKPAAKPPAKPAPKAAEKSPPPLPAAPKTKPAASPPPKSEPKTKKKAPPKAPNKAKPDATPQSKSPSPPPPAKADKPDWIIPPKAR